MSDGTKVKYVRDKVNYGSTRLFFGFQMDLGDKIRFFIEWFFTMLLDKEGEVKLMTIQLSPWVLEGG